MNAYHKLMYRCDVCKHEEDRWVLGSPITVPKHCRMCNAERPHTLSQTWPPVALPDHLLTHGCHCASCTKAREPKNWEYAGHAVRYCGGRWVCLTPCGKTMMCDKCHATITEHALRKLYDDQGPNAFKPQVYSVPEVRANEERAKRTEMEIKLKEKESELVQLKADLEFVKGITYAAPSEVPFMTNQSEYWRGHGKGFWLGFAVTLLGEAVIFTVYTWLKIGGCL